MLPTASIKEFDNIENDIGIMELCYLFIFSKVAIVSSMLG